MTEVLVVGGGPAGLAAALAAGRRGFETRLVEAGPALGGMAASFTIDGIRVDHGSHRLHPVTSPRVRRLLDELLGADLQVRERNGRLRLGGHWVRFPLRPADLARSAPPAIAAGILADAARRPLRRAGMPSYADVVRVGLGPTALERFHGPMATKLWGLEPDLLAAELAHRRIPVRNPGQLVAKIVRGARPGGRTFLYPRHGFGQITERLADAAVAAGVTIETGTEVTTIEPGLPEPVVAIGTESPSAVGRVLWTGAASGLLRVTESSAASAGPTSAAGVDPLRHRGLVLAYLTVPATTWTGYDAHYVPDPDIAFSRLSEPRNYRDGPDPGGRTVLCAELPCWPGDRTWQAEPAAIEALVLDGLARARLPIPTVDGVELRRLPAVYPVLTADAADQRQRLLASADGLPGITVLGRQGRGTGDNLHHVLDMALTAVDRLGPSGTWETASWVRATERFERFTVED